MSKIIENYILINDASIKRYKKKLDKLYKKLQKTMAEHYSNTRQLKRIAYDNPSSALILPYTNPSINRELSDPDYKFLKSLKGGIIIKKGENEDVLNLIKYNKKLNKTISDIDESIDTTKTKLEVLNKCEAFFKQQ